MELKAYMKTLGDEVEDFAKRCNTTKGQLIQVAGGHRRASESLSINIERESKRAVLCEELRPDVDWEFIRSTNTAA